MNTSPTTSREEIAANVRAAMARRQVDQNVIAAALGKSRQAVSTKVRGVAHFRVDELQTIAALLDVPLDTLLEPADQPAEATA
jgi:transcriptional regulator with XRE-family HTH domain